MPRPRSDIAPRIVASARDRFLRDGVDGASLRAIASDAGTSIGMVYYYFPTKDELFLAVIEESYERVLSDLEQALAPELPVERRLERLFERLARLSDDELKVVRLVVREALVSSERLDRVVERFKRGHVPLVVRAIFDGLADGTFDRGRNPLVIALATMMLAGPAQIFGRALGQRLPFAAAGSGLTTSAELLSVLLRGVGGERTREP